MKFDDIRISMLKHFAPKIKSNNNAATGESIIKVLLIEDNPIDAYISFSALTQNKSFNVIHAENITEALKCLEKYHFDVILLDLYLADNNGSDSFFIIKEKSPDTPIILVTGSDDEELAINFIREGAQDYLIKGKYNKDSLIRSIRYSIERENLLKKISELSMIDDLTGLYNRRAFFSMSDKAFETAKNKQQVFMAFFIDIDDMKMINDNYGHQAGDDALKKIADALKNIFENSGIVGRIGGDEFAVTVITDNIDKYLKELNDRIKEEIDEMDLPYKTSFSIGASVADYNTITTVEKLILKADKALYESKLNKYSERTEIIILSK